METTGNPMETTGNICKSCMTEKFKKTAREKVVKYVFGWMSGWI